MNLNAYGLTPEQTELLTPEQVQDLVEQEANVSLVARKLDVARGWVRRRVDKAKMISAGSEPPSYSPDGAGPEVPLVSPIDPEDLSLTGHSDFVDETTGQVVRRWNKYNRDDQARLERINQAIAAACERLPVLPAIPAPEHCLEDLANLYTITDYHLGMHASEAVSGTKWNTEISQRVLIEVFEAMFSMAPKAHTGIINIQGDFFHSDSLTPVTPTSGHVVDQDTRQEDLIDLGIELVERAIMLALMQHEHVILLVAEGNHDISYSLAMRTVFKRVFKDNPRVTVIDRKDPFYAIQWGKTALYIHHGHKKNMSKLEELALLFADRFRDIWGETQHRYGHSGHYHNLKTTTLKTARLRWTQHPTIAPNDAHSSREGYPEDRGALFITYSKRSGQVLQGEVTPDMLPHSLG